MIPLAMLSPLTELIIFAVFILACVALVLGGWIYIFSILFKLKRLCANTSNSAE